MRFNFKHASASRSQTQNVIASLTDNCGNTGYGEGCPRSYVTGETTATASLFLKNYGAEIAHEVDSIVSLKYWIDQNERLIDDNPSAFCALENAIIDLLARKKQVSVEKLLNLPELTQEVPYTAVIGDSPPFKMRLITTAYRLYGFTTFKVKLSGDFTRDQKRLAAIPAGSALRLDANNLWQNAEDCITYYQQLQPSAWALEEPVTAFDYESMNKISTSLNTAVILDESFFAAQHLSYLDACTGRYIANIRVSKCGGILRSIGLANRCIDANCDIIIGAHVGETSLLTRAALVVGQGLAKPPLAREGAYGSILLKRDITSQDIRFSRNGLLQPLAHRFSSMPGFGLTLTTDTIDWSI